MAKGYITEVKNIWFRVGSKGKWHRLGSKETYDNIEDDPEYRITLCSGHSVENTVNDDDNNIQQIQ